MQEWLKEISGFAAVTLQPAAGAHGEFTGVLMMRAYHKARGDQQTHQDAHPRFGARHQPGLGGHARLADRDQSPRMRAATWTWKRSKPPATIPSSA